MYRAEQKVHTLPLLEEDLDGTEALSFFSFCGCAKYSISRLINSSLVPDFSNPNNPKISFKKYNSNCKHNHKIN